MFPFALVTDEALLASNDIHNSSNYGPTPPLEIVSKLTSLPNLSDYDIDENLIPNISSQYYTLRELSSLEVSNKDLALFHMNIHSLSLHYKELHALLTTANFEFQVIGLSEIKASNDAPLKSNIGLPGYKVYHTTSFSAAGGVGIYVKSNLTAYTRDDLSTSDIDFETVWIEINNPKTKNILCCCAYRHPSSDIAKFTDHLQQALSSITKENKLIFVMGDFDINLLNYENHTLTNEFINVIFSFHLMPSTLHPTRITDTTSTFIDNIFLSNTTDSDISGGNILSLISDHLPQFAIVNNSAPDYNNISYFVYDYSKFDETKVLTEYSEIHTAYLNDDSVDLNVNFERFMHDIHSLINKHCPKKKLNKKALKLRNKPWINSQIRRMMKVRDALFHQFKITNSSTVLAAYKQFRNLIVNEINISKRQYYCQYFDENKSNMKRLWKGIKDIISLKPGQCNTVSHLINEEGTKVSDPVTIANDFNEYFTTIAGEITKKFLEFQNHL